MEITVCQRLDEVSIRQWGTRGEKVCFVDALERTSVGKLDKKVPRQKYC